LCTEQINKEYEISIEKDSCFSRLINFFFFCHS